MLETFGNGSHKHTHTHTHTHAGLFLFSGFQGKKGKMTSSLSCEANETDEGGGENTGRNRTLLHKTQLSADLPWALSPYCVCLYACVRACLNVHACAGLLKYVCKMIRSTIPEQGVPLKKEIDRYLQSDCRKQHYVTAQLQSFNAFQGL